MRRGSAALLVAVAVLPGCGASTPSALTTVHLTVLAASSLTSVFPKIGEAFTATHRGVAFQFTFGGTDALVADVEQGAPADVFAGASAKYGDRLVTDGRIVTARPFATNRLVLVVPSSNPANVSSPRDLTRAGIKLVVGAASVPIGSYTRTVLMNLDAAYGGDYASRALANVVSDEDSVSGVLTKVESGEADAGFVYVTDALAAGSQVTAITLPASAQAIATYPIAVVKASTHAGPATQFVGFVLDPQAQALLRIAGFGPPPHV
jgi:molybdate transport system substrate-binding protein